MAITRTPIVDDSGTGTDGTVLGNAWKQELYDQIDDALAALATPSVQGRACDGRLTLTSGTPVTTADVTGATSIYFTPFGGSGIDLYASGTWSTLAFTELTLALGTVTSGACYDIFAYNNSSVVALEKLVWTNTTTRATALARQDGTLVKSGDATRRYVGSFYTTSTTTTEDSAAKRYVWNYYHRAHRPVQRYETTASWTYATAAWHQANAAAANQIELVVGVAEVTLDLWLAVLASNSGTNFSYSGIGLDSTSSPAMVVGNSGPAGLTIEITGRYVAMPTVGRHFYPWLEFVSGGTTTYSGASFSSQTGLQGTIEG